MLQNIFFQLVSSLWSIFYTLLPQFWLEFLWFLLVAWVWVFKWIPVKIWFRFRVALSVQSNWVFFPPSFCAWSFVPFANFQSQLYGNFLSSARTGWTETPWDRTVTLRFRWLPAFCVFGRPVTPSSRTVVNQRPGFADWAPCFPCSWTGFSNRSLAISNVPFNWASSWLFSSESY